MGRLKADLAKLLRSDDPDVLQAALLLGQLEGREGDPRWGAETVETLAQGLRSRLDPSRLKPSSARKASRYLFRTQGLRPVRPREREPGDLHLVEVLRRRRGDPLVLGLLYWEVGRRAGLPLEPVEVDGRLLVRWRGPSGSLLLDPGRGGRPVEIHRRMTGDANLDALPAAPARALLALLLHRLKEAYRGKDDLERMGVVVDLLLLLEPETPEARRERGLVRLEQGNLLEAKADLRRYLEACPDAPDAPVIHGYLEEVDVRVRALARAWDVDVGPSPPG